MIIVIPVYSHFFMRHWRRRNDGRVRNGKRFAVVIESSQISSVYKAYELLELIGVGTPLIRIHLPIFDPKPMAVVPEILDGNIRVFLRSDVEIAALNTNEECWYQGLGRVVFEATSEYLVAFSLLGQFFHLFTRFSARVMVALN